MRRGTTPTINFTIPYTKDIIEDGWITFKQRNDIVLDKRITDENVTVTDLCISVELTQVETLRFSQESRTPAKVQIRLVLSGDKTTASNVVDIPIGEILKEGVI